MPTRKQSESCLEQADTAMFEQLQRTNSELISYIRTKTNRLLQVMGTVALNPEELDDTTLLSVDPIGIVSESFEQVLEHLKEINTDLIETRDELQAVFDSAGAGIVVVDDQMRVTACNHYSQMLLFDGEEQVLGKNIRHLICGHDTEECILDQILSSKCRVEQNNFQHNGRYYHLVGTPLKDGEGSIQHMILLYTDVTERRTAAQEIERLAFFDSLTGLPNRVLLKDRLSQMLNRAERRSVLVAVLFIDLDHFKEVNDTLGHSSGDLLLQKVAERLTGSLRSCDTVARLGGDEFVVLLEDLNDRDAVTDVAVKLLTSLNEAVQLGERKVYTGGSIGVSLFPDDGSDVETLFKNADTAMYQAKALGRNRFCFYSEEMHESVMEQLTLSSSLRLACDRKEFYLVYQPQINLATGQLVGVEVLLRWEHPALGMIPTDRFIPVAEETGLMVPIGAWVLETACLQVMQWVRQGFPELRIAVNLSLQQFRDPGLVETIQAVLHCSGLPSHLLELELTEKVLVADITSSRATLQKLKALGITIAIDDFGIGYSSLSYLRHFPLDRLKIDMSFVQDIAEQSDDAAVIIDALIALAHGLNLSVIAERVEFTEQVLFLKQRLCDELQGYYISRPLPRETFEQVLKQCVQESDFCLFTCQ